MPQISRKCTAASTASGAPSAGQFLRKNQKRQYVYVAPVDIQAVRQQFPEAAPYLAREFRDSLQKEVSLLIDRRNAQPGAHTHWVLSNRPRTPGVQISLAIVHLKPTDAGEKVAALGVGIVSPIPGISFLINHLASEAVGIEGNITALDNGTAVKEFYGRNRDPVNIFSCNSFEEFTRDSTTWTALPGRLRKCWRKTRYSPDFFHAGKTLDDNRVMSLTPGARTPS